MKTAAVYLLSNRRNGTLFVGATEDLVATVTGHKEGRIWGFAKKYNLTRLVHFEALATPKDVQARTEAIRRMGRKRKVAMIEAQNPRWGDLYDGMVRAVGG